MLPPVEVLIGERERTVREDEMKAGLLPIRLGTVPGLPALVTVVAGACFLVVPLRTEAGPRESACRADLASDSLLYWLVDGMFYFVEDEGTSDIFTKFSAVLDSRNALGEVPLSFGSDLTLKITEHFVEFDWIWRFVNFRFFDDYLRLNPFDLQMYLDSYDDETSGYSTFALFGRSLVGVRWRVSELDQDALSTSGVFAFMDFYGGIRYGLVSDTTYSEAAETCYDQYMGYSYYCPKEADELGVVPYLRLRADVTDAESVAYNGSFLFSMYSGSSYQDNIPYIGMEHKVAFSIGSVFAAEIGLSFETDFGERTNTFMLLLGLAGSSVFMPCSE